MYAFAFALDDQEVPELGVVVFRGVFSAAM
jgi:hypothetical protein